MTYVERLRNAAHLVDNAEVASLLILSADRIEQLNMWKLKWAETDHAYAELAGRYHELKEQFDAYRRKHGD
ncbi:hypothetical protein [Phage DSL-LC04]|jgi:hypothetical protein|nr:hypothetical protein [Phage DSL-LC04]